MWPTILQKYFFHINTIIFFSPSITKNLGQFLFFVFFSLTKLRSVLFPIKTSHEDHLKMNISALYSYRDDMKEYTDIIFFTPENVVKLLLKPRNICFVSITMESPNIL